MRKLVVLALVIVLLFGSGFGTNASDKTFNLEVEPDCGFNVLIWDEVPGATQYFIYRGNAPGEEFETPLLDFPLQDTSFKDEINIKNGQEYCYFVTALDSSASEFARSNEACAIPSCYEEPDEDDCKLILRYQQDNKTYMANGEQKDMDTPPVNVNSRLFLVVRYVAQEIPGTTIDWVDATKTVIITTRDGKRIELQIGNKDAKIDGQITQIDPNNPGVVPFITEGRAHTPMRFIAENLGATGPDDIRWYGDTKTVELRFDDPMCEKIGILDATTERLDDGRYRISAIYYASEGEIPEVSLLLTRKQNNKKLTIGGDRDKPNFKGDFKVIKTDKPTLTKMKPEHGKATKFSWVIQLDPGVMYFYGFEAKTTKERLPEKGFLGPLLIPLEGIKRISELDLKKMKTGEEETLQGYFSHEPYPMLFEDYWKIYERSAPEPGTAVHVRLPQNSIIEPGDYISCKVKKSSSKNLTPILKLTDFSIIQKIELAKTYEVTPIQATYSDLYEALCRCKYGIMFTGGSDTKKVEDDEGDEHRYKRLRADFVADSIRGYDTMRMMGICKENIHFLYGAGNHGIDYISADDGDGNPFDFEWTDAIYRAQMEDEAEERWRADDGWRVKSATKNNFENAIDAIVADIGANEECTPEITIFVSDHGSRGWSEASEEDGKPGYICSNSGDWLDDTWFTDQMKRVTSACGWGRKPKIRVMLGTCHAGEFVDDFNDKLKTAGLDAVCLATASDDAGNGYGSYGNASNATYGEGTGGTFGTPFHHNLREQIEDGVDEISWRDAYDYAYDNDKFVDGDWASSPGGDIWVFSNPWYWHSSDMTAIMPGHIIPEVDPGTVRMNPCQLAVDASGLTYNVCNCHHVDFGNDFRRPITLENMSNYPMEVILTCPDYSMLSACHERFDVAFAWEDRMGTFDYEELTVELDARESIEVFTSMSTYWLQKQPLDENGHMATDGGLPEFIEVPIHVEYICEVSDDESFRNSYDVPVFIRAHGMAFDVEYSVDAERRLSYDVSVTINNNHHTIKSLTPELSDVAPNVIAVPNTEGDVRLELETPAFEITPEEGSYYNFLNHFDVMLDVVDTDENACYEPDSEKRINWGNASIKTPGSKGISEESRWELIEFRVPAKLNDKRIVLRLNGTPSDPMAIIGVHDIIVSYELNDCHCCENFRRGEPGPARKVEIHLRVNITDPRLRSVDSEFYQAI